MTNAKAVHADHPGAEAAARDQRSREERARAREADLVLALEAGHMGIFSFDLATQQIRSTATFAELHGRPADRTNLHFEESLTNVHPDDRPLVRDVDLREGRLEPRLQRRSGDVLDRTGCRRSR